MFEKIRYYYNLGLYKEKHLAKLLAIGVLTDEQYNKILKGQ